MNSSQLKKDLYRYFKFIFGGGLSLLLNLAITYIFTEYLQLWHMLSYAIALSIEIFFLFTYHSLVTFKKKGRFWLFVIVILFISGLNWSAVYLLSVILKMPYLIAIVIAALTISIINYLLNKKLVFKP